MGGHTKPLLVLVSAVDDVSEVWPAESLVPVPEPAVEVVRVVGAEAELSVTVAVPLLVPLDVLAPVTETGEAPGTPP